MGAGHSAARLKTRRKLRYKNACPKRVSVYAALAMALERELKHFEAIKADLLKNHAGKFALIKGEEFLGAFDSPDNAFKAGVDRFGKEIFLIKKISEQEEVYRNQALFLGLMNAYI